MNIFGQNVIAKIEGDSIEKIQVHWVIREVDTWNWINTALCDPKLWYIEVVSQRIAADWWCYS